MLSPFSGSASAFCVVKTLQKLALDGSRTILLSIHQPSSEVFELFDKLMLLSGGTTVYFGDTEGAFEVQNLPNCTLSVSVSFLVFLAHELNDEVISFRAFKYLGKNITCNCCQKQFCMHSGLSNAESNIRKKK
jgi:hypothetical protein